MLLGGAAVAVAQQYTPPPKLPPVSTPSPQATQVSPRTLAKFKKAYWSVQSIQKQYAAKLQRTHGNKSAATLREWVQSKIAHAVKSAGLTIPKYDKVMMLMQREPALRKRVLGH